MSRDYGQRDNQHNQNVHETAQIKIAHLEQRIAELEATVERAQAAITEQRKRTWIDDTGRVRHPYENEFLDKLENALNTGETK